MLRRCYKRIENRQYHETSENSETSTKGSPDDGLTDARIPLLMPKDQTNCRCQHPLKPQPPNDGNGWCAPLSPIDGTQQTLDRN
ncbi:hypothetical protein B9Z55_021218 [Caenorhabditis nigoni]|uniref:Uncharacterized protein n=1 Tax=Caenorhabditis nigoni TaxID=1611254 RepID=A0A2G5TQY9_9PELO|nr:hypothetical protein B9Z55_021218 [Caenorhabditis nigoni]